MGLSESNWKLWLIFALCLAVSQALNLWSTFPNYEDRFVFGFPLIYFQHQQGAEYVYFNLVFLVIDLFIWYLVAKALVFGYGQLTKYKIIK